MNHHLLPDWNFEGDVPVPNQKKPMGQDHELVELLWRNGQVVLHSQTQRKQGLPPNESRQVQKHDQLTMLRNGGPYGNWSNLVQDEETISWIQYPLEDSIDKEFCSNLFMEFPPNLDPIQPEKPVRNSEEEGKSVSNVVPASQQPPYKQLGTLEFAGNPMPPPKFPVQQNPNPGKIVNFSNFSLPGRNNLGSCRPQLGGKGKGTGGAGKECSVMTAGLMSHCGSNQLVNEADLSLFSSRDNVLRMVSQADGKQTETLEPTVTSSSGGGSGSSFGRTYKQSTDGKSHKRKMREAEESECQSEAAEDESAARNKKSQRSGSGSTRRSRAAEVHNLSERRRRDRINEKMRALQELIPHSNKSDKASMLDEAIEYLKSLQLQLQLMWMGTGVSPMMFPGVQHYMPRMGMGMCPSSLPSIHNQMHLQRVQLLDQAAMPAAPPPNQPQICQTQVLNPVNYQHQMQNPNFSEQFAHYMGFHPMQIPSQPMNVFSFGSQSHATTSPAITGGPHAGADGAPSSKLG